MSNAYNRAVRRVKEAYLAKQDEPVRRRLKLLDNLNSVMMILGLALGFSCIFTDPVHLLIKLMHTKPSTVYLVTVNSAILGIPYIMATFVLATVVTLPILSRLAGPYRDKWEEFIKLGSNSKRLDLGVQTIACVFLFCCACMLLLSLDAYLVVSNDGIDLNHFWGVGSSHYNWSQVEAVQEVHHGKYFYYRIDLTDGNDWKSDDSSFRSTWMTAKPAVEYVSSTSGKKIDYVWKQER